MAIISKCRPTVHKGIDSTYSFSPYVSLENGYGVDLITLIFKRSIRAEVVTYRFYVVFGSLHMQHSMVSMNCVTSKESFGTAVQRLRRKPYHIKFSASYLSFRFQDQDTRLRMPNKWHICKEGRSRQQKEDNAAACLCFLNYLAFLRPAADRAVSILTWVVSRGRSYGFL
jgi:hypothetical protein